MGGIIGALYRKIIEKRLEVAPEAATALLDVAAVQRILGEEAVGEYRRQVAALEREGKLRREAAALIDEEATPAEVKAVAKGRPAEEGEALLLRYGELRYQENRKKYLTQILNIDTVWKELLGNDGNVQQIPAWVRNSDPQLYAAVLENWELREENGGMAPAPDFALFVKFVEEYDAEEVAERFRDAGELYGFITRLGGPDSDAFQAALRVMVGKATQGDYAWVRDLRMALDKFGAGESFTGEVDGDVQECLLRFDRVRRIMLERTGHEELDEFEVREVLARL